MDEKRKERIMRNAEFLGTVVTEHHTLHTDNLHRVAEAVEERREQIIRDAEGVRELINARETAAPETEKKPDAEALALEKARHMALESAGLGEGTAKFTRCEWTDYQGERLVYLEFEADGMHYECYAEPQTGRVDGFSEAPADSAF